jgi:hypothetical protein
MVNSSQDFTLRLQFDIKTHNRHDSTFHAKVQYHAFSTIKWTHVSLFSFITSFYCCTASFT